MNKNTIGEYKDDKYCPFNFVGKCTLHSYDDVQTYCMGIEFCKNQLVFK